VPIFGTDVEKVIKMQKLVMPMFTFVEQM